MALPYHPARMAIFCPVETCSTTAKILRIWTACRGGSKVVSSSKRTRPAKSSGVSTPTHHHDGVDWPTAMSSFWPQNRSLRSGGSGERRNSRYRMEWHHSSGCPSRVSAPGEVVWSWHAYEHLDPEQTSSRRTTARGMEPCQYVGEWPTAIHHELAQLSTVVIIDRGSGKIIWRLGRELLSHHTILMSSKTAIS